MSYSDKMMEIIKEFSITPHAELFDISEEADKEFEQLKKDNEDLKDLCREFTSISRVAMNNHHVLVELCDKWSELRANDPSNYGHHN